MGRSKNFYQNKKEAKKNRKPILVHVIGSFDFCHQHDFEAAFKSHLNDPKNGGTTIDTHIRTSRVKNILQSMKLMTYSLITKTRNNF